MPLHRPISLQKALFILSQLPGQHKAPFPPDALLGPLWLQHVLLSAAGPVCTCQTHRHTSPTGVPARGCRWPLHPKLCVERPTAACHPPVGPRPSQGDRNGQGAALGRGRDLGGVCERAAGLPGAGMGMGLHLGGPLPPCVPAKAGSGPQPAAERQAELQVSVPRTDTVCTLLLGWGHRDCAARAAGGGVRRDPRGQWAAAWRGGMVFPAVVLKYGLTA